MPIPNEIVRELLAPTSPLMVQPPELREALDPVDGYTARIALNEICTKLSPEAGHAIFGLALYWQHIAALRKGNDELAAEIFKRGEDEFKGIINDLRRLGDLVEGVALGWLYAEGHAAASDLVESVFGKGTPEAKAILGRIKRRRRGPWRLWIKFLADERSMAYIRRSGRQVKDFPRRSADKAPTENSAPTEATPPESDHTPRQ